MILKTDNYYLKQIFVNTGGEAPPTHRTNNWYLKGILENYTGETITTKHTSNIYLKNIYSTVSGETISEKHNNNYFLRKILESLSGESVELNRTDNYYLSKIASIESVPLEPSLTLSVDKKIVAQNMSDKNVVATAILLDENEQPIANKVVTFVVEYGTAKDTSTAQTDSNGEASFTYTSNGNGDVKISTEYHNVIDSVTFEDYMYYNTNEVIRNSRNGATIYDNDLSLTLPSKCEISFDFHSNVSGNYDHRFFLLPKSQFSTSTTQPQYAVYVEQNNRYQASLGKRENNNSILILSKFNCQGNSYPTAKWVRDGTSIDIYVDDELKTTQTIDWIDNYDDYCFCMMIWSSTYSSKMKNVKVKAL